MGFLLTRLDITNFRNHQSFVLEDPKKTVVIIGPNAAGKSSILEALQLLCMQESFRTADWQELVLEKSQPCKVKGRFIDNDQVMDIEMSVTEGKREYYLNGKLRRQMNTGDKLTAILFIPDDLNLVKGPAEQRRLCIDNLGKSLSKQYRLILTDYAKTLRQRNSILKERQKARLFDLPPSQEEVVWEDRLAELGALLSVNRYKLYLRLMDRAAQHYKLLSEGEQLSYVYTPSYQPNNPVTLPTLDKNAVQSAILRAIEKRRSDEYIRGISLVGPHKDEISFLVDGRDARSFASQGQQRSIALAVKIAELDVIREISGCQALLLLDDVLSELDDKRRIQLLKACTTVEQSFITTTDITVIPKEYYINGTVVELKGNR